MTNVFSMKSPSDGTKKDPNDMRDDLQYLGDVEASIKTSVLNPRSEKAPAHNTDSGDLLSRLVQLSATNRIDEMRENLSNEFYIFEDMALGGVITLFYAWPNTGKTLLFLRFIIDAIGDGRINGEDVFYINADDNYKGLYTKTKIAKDHGFHMISPQEAGTAPNDVLEILHGLAVTDRVKGKIIILDTLKKFTDMMNKKAQAALYEVLRTLVTKGASVVIAGHANKHKDADGNLVYEGTGDTMNDIDCAYAIYQMTDRDAPIQVVEFRREKDRGDIIAKVSYQYEKRTGMNYMDIIDSVRRLDDGQADAAAKEKAHQDLKAKYESEVLVIHELLQDGPLNQSAILSRYREVGDLADEVSRSKLSTALIKLAGIEWTVTRGEKNAKYFDLVGRAANEYRRASRG